MTKLCIRPGRFKLFDLKSRVLVGALGLLFAVGFGSRARSQEPSSVAGNEEVADFIKSFSARGVMSDGSQPTPADEAVKQFEVLEGLQIELMASEPDVSQPLFLSWDSRGRMWVVQYRQYQFPAGLKVVRYDQHLRAVFDKVPEPPPQGVSGKDVITVFEDTDHDGLFDTHHDVITGLNIATSVQTGHGGIWVLNPPYLLFYPDANGDDVPDAAPEVHLSGFGLQDTHSVANSLLWGPDGWLYGANGSTTAGTISSSVTRGVQFEGQCIWRYHPDTHVFEIYAEGGGNTFSLEIDSKGRVFSGYNGGNTRGFYFPQGSYSSKNWGKHGPLTNPFALGYFQHMQLEGDPRRFAQAFTIYEGGIFPEHLTGNIFAPNAMVNLVWNSKLLPHGSTYRTQDLDNLAESPDRWFRPVYAGVGPDGGVYIADWYDTRLSHVSPLDDWHKESGRVYRISPTGSKPQIELGDLHRVPAEHLLELLSHENKWVRNRAVLEIGWRKERHLLPRLIELVERDDSLEALWCVNLLDELSDQRAAEWLGSHDEHIRRWVVRLLGDRQHAIPELVELAKQEPSVQVRSQLAATAKRIPADIGLRIVAELLRHADDAEDPHMPLMIWWALEAHADEWSGVRKLFTQSDIWRQTLVQQFIASRLAQRYATIAKPEDLARCDELVAICDDEDSRRALLDGLLRAFPGRDIPELPTAIAQALERYQTSLGSAGLVIGLKQNPEASLQPALQIAGDSQQPLGLRIDVVRALSETRHKAALDSLLQLAVANSEPAIQRVAIIALRTFDDPSIAENLVSQMGNSISAEHDLRDTACRTLASRPEWARILLREIDQWRLRPSDVPADVVQQLRAYEQPDIHELVMKSFGKAVTLSSAAKVEAMRNLQEVLSAEPGDAELGKRHFTKVCSSCHRLFGEGKDIGPPLDNYNRGDPTFWLIAIIEPSAEIREGYQSYAARTDDGRVVTGMIAAQDTNRITIRSADDQLTVLQRDEIETLKAMPTSLMPEDLLRQLSDQDVRDLMAYLSLGAKR